MLTYVLQRILWLIPVIIGVSFLVFSLMSLAEGDELTVMLADTEFSEEQIDELRRQQGLDRSMIYRYGVYMSNLVRGDLGVSPVTRTRVVETYFNRLPATLQLAGAATLVVIILAIPLGILSALRAGGTADNITAVLALIGLSMPNFWLGLLLIIGFSLQLGWFPSGGNTLGWRSYILPALTLGTGHVAAIAMITRAAMLDVLQTDYLRTARAKGNPERTIVFKHALRNALIPIIAIFGTQLGSMIGGSVLTETVFSWPGVGRSIIEAVNRRDTVTATGFIIMTTILFSIVLLIVDLLYVAVDPRLRTRFSKSGKA